MTTLERIIQIEVMPHAGAVYGWMWRHAVRDWQGPEATREAAIEAAATDIVRWAVIGSVYERDGSQAADAALARFDDSE